MLLCSTSPRQQQIYGVHADQEKKRPGKQIRIAHTSTLFQSTSPPSRPNLEGRIEVTKITNIRFKIVGNFEQVYRGAFSFLGEITRTPL
jgi:hypothetical protein